MDKRVAKITVAVVLIMILLAGGSFAYTLTKRANGRSGIIAPHSQPNMPEAPGQAVTKTGTVMCLAHKDKGVTTQECATGLKTDDGSAYGLEADDPTVIGKLPRDSQRVEVTGTLAASSNSTYDTVGTIQVLSARAL